MSEVIVIGAGAAGIIAAWKAATGGAKVTLLEKTERIGTKILISGGGKCNITHDGPIEDVLRAFRPNEARFIRPSCYRFLNTEIVEMLTSRGLRVYTRPDGRIFPVDQTARAVVGILGDYLREAGVLVRLMTPVLGIERDEVGALGVRTADGLQDCRHVVLATGGSSYPKSGTTGDGWAWAKALGHTIVPVTAALAPMDVTVDEAMRIESGLDWPLPPGVALRDILLKARAGGKEVARWRGDLLMTHHGVSGPCALGVSRVAAEKLMDGPVQIEVDLCPDETFETLGAQVRTWTAANPLKSLSALQFGDLPDSLLPYFWASVGQPRDLRFQSLSKKDTNRLVETLKGWKIGRVTAVPLEKGEVVAGGVGLDEVDPQSMRSAVCPGLYLCGEVLDLAGPVGGYNLQAAFATGFVAGETAAHDLLGPS